MRTNAIIILIILSITMLVYSNAVFIDFCGYDDDLYIQQNDVVKDLSTKGIGNMFTETFGYYMPLTYLSWAIEYHFAGLNPHVFHFNNLLLHLINTLLCFFFILTLTKNNWVAGFTALFFAIHPMHVESVTWITERKDLLFSTFYLAALITYCQYRFNEKTKYYWYTLILFILSLLSKPTALTLPFILILIDYYLKNDWRSLRNIIQKTPFFLLTIVSILATFLFVKQTNVFYDLSTDYGLSERLAIIAHTAFYYLKSAIHPTLFSAIHPFPHQVPLSYYLTPIWILGLMVGFIFLGKKIKDNNFERNMYFGIGFFLAGISLFLNLKPASTTIVCERYTYLPYIGLFLFIVQSGWILLKNSKKAKAPILMAVTISAIYFSVQTFERNKAWKNAKTLYSDVIRKYPDYIQGHFGLGDLNLNRGEIKKSIEQFSRVIEIDSTYAKAYNNRGNAYLRSQNFEMAISDYSTAINLFQGYFAPLNNRAYIYTQLQQYEKALNDYKTILGFKPNHVKTLFKCGLTYEQMGNTKLAIDSYSRAIQITPTDVESLLHRGRLYYYAKKKEQACCDWQQALSSGSKKARQLIQTYCK